MLVVGDIGGTNTRLELREPGRSKPVRAETLKSESFRSLEAALGYFLRGDAPRIRGACFGVAGPVLGGLARVTNLPWTIDAKKLTRHLRAEFVDVINDLVAVGRGALTAPAGRIESLRGGRPVKRGEHVAVIAAGTGLGEALFFWDGERYVGAPTEGGHTGFAPRNAAEDELLHYARERVGGRVSVERIVSGPGLSLIYDFFVDVAGMRDTPQNTKVIEAAPDRSRAISELGLAKRSKPARGAVRLFTQLYGAEAGDLVLKSLATGGIYIAGHVASTMLELLRGPDFEDAFLDKGRMRPVVASVPVAVAMGDDLGLRGAYATALARTERLEAPSPRRARASKKSSKTSKP